jgi:phosphonate transport system substrate-binding protein
VINSTTTSKSSFVRGILGSGALLLALGAGSAAAQSDAQAAIRAMDPSKRITLAVNEGGAAHAAYTETQLRFEEFTHLVQKAMGKPVLIVSARNRDRLQENLKKGAYPLLLARPNDVPAQAVRDWGYQVIAVAKEPSQCWLVVPKDSTIKTIGDIKGKTIVTPDQYSNMWRVANAMLRDAGIDMSREAVKSMRDQQAIAWSLQNGFYQVGVINSVSGVAKTWEKNGGRVVAKSRDLPNMPFIASPDITPEQLARLRTAVVGLDKTDEGRVILKKIGLTGFQETPAKTMLDFLAWIGDLNIKPE